MIYITSPYTHSDLAIMQARYEKVMAFTAWLIRDAYPAFSPIVHGHELAIRHELPKDFTFWRGYALSLLAAADALYVLCVDGWETSAGVKAEIAFARRSGLSITFWREGRDCAYERMSVEAK